MIAICNLRIRLSFLLEFHPRLQRQWTHKNWLYKFKCMRRCQRSIRGKKKRSIRKSILKRSVGRPKNILRKKRLHLMVKEPPDLCMKIQRSSQKAISVLKRMTSSHPLIKEEQPQTLILILVQVQALQAANPKKIIQVDQKFRSPSLPLKWVTSWTCYHLMLPRPQFSQFNLSHKYRLRSLTIYLVALISPLFTYPSLKHPKQIHSKL